jgi:hypothetical protein
MGNYFLRVEKLARYITIKNYRKTKLKVTNEVRGESYLY